MMKDAMKDEKEEPESWDDWSKYIMNVAKRVGGISKGGHNQKTTWLWNEEVKRRSSRRKGVCIKYGRRKKTNDQKNNTGL